MGFKKKLFMIIGPVIVAIILLLVILLAPVKYSFSSAKTEEKAAISQSNKVLKGSAIRQEALEDGYVAFIGSSEFSRMDSMHPSVLAQKYKRSYRPFLMGTGGTQSLTHYFDLQGIKGQLKNKKAVFVVSPQWFVPGGVKKGVFNNFYSPLQTTEWLLSANANSQSDRYAAGRFIDLMSGEGNEAVLKAMHKIANGHPLSEFDASQFRIKLTMLQHEDQLFSGHPMMNRLPIINKQVKNLPAKYDLNALNVLAGQFGAKATTDNDFAIKNSYWKRHLNKTVGKLANKQVNLNYNRSVEFSDFQLVLNQFAKQHTDVLFIIPPVNERWSNYTGLSTEMLANYDSKITHQLKSQGFNRIADFSQRGNEKYFMEDTIHLGWKGWVAVDSYVNPFLTQKQVKPKYHLSNEYYSDAWQQKLN
ncbi:D-alanyl-lipoteichoic acid biosynthesis protein DltD [Dellaglioa sp. L3N]